MIKSVPIKDIRIDGNTQQRPVDDNVVKRYAALMKDGFKFPPVEIITDGKSKYLTDGYHRYFAAIKLGKKYIEANVIEGTQRDAIYLSFSANKDNAFPRQPGTAKEIDYRENLKRQRMVENVAKGDCKSCRMYGEICIPDSVGNIKNLSYEQFRG